MRILKSRIFLAFICAAGAAAIAFFVIPNMYKDQEVRVQALRFSTSLQKGDLISYAALEVVEMGALNLPPGIIFDKEAVVGKYAQTVVSKGDFVFSDKIGDYIFDKTLDAVIAQKKRLVTITVPSTAAGLFSHLKKGDIVHIACYIPEKEQYTIEGVLFEPSQIEIPYEMRNLTVYGVENAQTESTEHARELIEAENRTVSADPIPKLITLIATEAQAIRLVEAEYSGKLHLIFVSRPIQWEDSI